MQPKREIHGLGFRVSPATQMQSVKNRTSWNTKEASSDVKSRYRMGCSLLEGRLGSQIQDLKFAVRVRLDLS